MSTTRTDPEVTHNLRRIGHVPPGPGCCDNCDEWEGERNLTTAPESWPLAYGFVEPMRLCDRCLRFITRNMADLGIEAL